MTKPRVGNDHTGCNSQGEMPEVSVKLKVGFGGETGFTGKGLGGILDRQWELTVRKDTGTRWEQLFSWHDCAWQGVM